MTLQQNKKRTTSVRFGGPSGNANPTTTPIPISPAVLSTPTTSTPSVPH